MSARDPDRGYITWRPTQRIADKLEAVLDVLATYHDHLPMTVRQVFYVLVARLVIQKTQAEYRNLAYLLRKARRARLVPFESIHDQGSVLPHSLTGWSDPGDLARLIRHVVENFDLDPQLDQARRLVVWCEAAGMLAQLERVAGPYGVHVVTGGGFDSLSDKWRFSRLVRRSREQFEVLHIGDLDRHGESIFDVLAEDVQAFDDYRNVSFTRLAVTEQQAHALGLESSVEDELIIRPKRFRPTCSPSSSTRPSGSGSTSTSWPKWRSAARGSAPTTRRRCAALACGRAARDCPSQAIPRLRWRPGPGD